MFLVSDGNVFSTLSSIQPGLLLLDEERAEGPFAQNPAAFPDRPRESDH